MSIAAIVNPASGSGGAAKAWEQVRTRLKSKSDTFATKYPGHAVELTRNAIRAGADRIVAVGGDGTINEVVNGFFEHETLISSSVALGIVPYGTGCDLQRTLRLPVDSDQSAALLERGNSRSVDILRVCYTKPDGNVGLRYSINVTSFGMGGIVASRVSRSRKIWGGKASFVLATIHAALGFKGNAMVLAFDDEKRIESVVTNVAAGNGRYHGGGMLVCPRAEIDDGLIDITLISFMRLPELVRNLRLLYNGEIYRHPKARFLRAQKLRAESHEPALIEIDGESLGHLPVEISILPRAIRILA